MLPVATGADAAIATPKVAQSQLTQRQAVAKKLTPLVRDCPSNKATIKPHGLLLACADGNEYLARLNWKVWASTKATAAGTLHLNDCKPDCASGTFRAYKASVVLTKVKRSKAGKAFYTRYSLSWVQGGKRHTENAMPISF
jgi:hypothetical protein